MVTSVKQTDGHPNNANPAQQLSLEAVSTQAIRLLEQAPAGETTGAKLSRLLDGFLHNELLPQADRAAGYGIDPAPLLAVIADILCLYADALRPPEPPTNHPARSSRQSSVT